MVVHRAFGQAAQLVDDILYGGVFVPLLQKQACGGILNLFPGLFWVFIPAHSFSLHTNGMYKA